MQSYRIVSAAAVALLSVATISRSAYPQDMPGMPGMPGMHHGTMVGPLGISMDRMGSGTTWIPDAVSLPSTHKTIAGWNVALHGLAFLQYNKQGGPRGEQQFGSLNWAMLMASRPLAGGRFEARTMLSLDPATVTARGYPLLLQTGETYRNAPLHDFQHPHDFWMELAALYEREISRKIAFSLYVAPSGEPALGPVAFMHRPSALDDPMAPLGHHWMDATHISFGVVTAGLYTKRVKVEGSFFNGRAPDESRWNFDRIKLDSYSGRITVNPDSNWSISAGFGFLESPESLQPDESMRRATLGILHGKKVGSEGLWSSAIVIGANNHSGQARWTAAALIESEFIVDHRNTVFARIETVQKSSEDLVLPTAGPNALSAGEVFPVASASLGYIRDVGAAHGATFGIGARATVNSVPQSLEPFYGSRNPVGGMIFLRMRAVHKD